MSRAEDLRKGDVVKATGFYVRYWDGVIGIITEIGSEGPTSGQLHIYVDLVFEPAYNLVFYPNELEVLGHVEDAV